MKLTKKLEAEIKALMEDYWNSYFEGNLDHWANYLVDNYRNIGGTEEELWNSKKEIVDYTYRIINQMQGATELRNKQTQIIPYDPYIMVHELLDIYIKIEDSWTFYQKFRLSSLIQKTTEGWKVLHQHGSYPDSKTTEGEAFAFDTLKSENKKLQKAIQQRTIELEQKNRELEIETALERVRAIALSMQEPAAMLDICKTISQQLELLGVMEIRNVQTAIIYESKGTYLNYEFYAKHNQLLVTEVDFKNHEIQKKFADQMLTGAEELFTVIMEGKKLKEWYAYQKTTNQFADNYLQKAASLNYYWYSLGPVALGISTYSPLGEHEIHLFKRFRNVFELAYRRFIDIEKAIAQSREARIETALERVRAVAMAMRKPEELLDICETLYMELQSLGFTDMRNSMINIYNDEKETFVNYDYSDAIGQSINQLHYNIHPVIEKQIKQLRGANDAFSESVFEGKDLEEMKTFRIKIGEKDDPRINNSAAIYYYFYSIGIGSIGISSFNSLTADKLEVLKRFRNVFSLAYQRYTDISLALEQSKEAQIQLALERVRARTMAMQKSKELADVVTLLFQQFKNLEVLPDAARVFFNLIDEKSATSEIWTTKEDGILRPGSHRISLNANTHLKRVFASWKVQKTIYIGVLTGKVVIDYLNYLSTVQDLSGDEVLQQLVISPPDKLVFTEAFFKQGTIGIVSADLLLPDSQNTLARFAIAFEQTYTRFLDLQKAEAQAREAHIEAALERVRSRSLAMYKTDDLGGVVTVLFQQMQGLSVDMGFASVSIFIFEKDTKNMIQWLQLPDGVVSLRIPYFEHPISSDLLEAKESGADYFSKAYTVEEKNTWVQKGFELTDYKKLPEAFKISLLDAPGYAMAIALANNSGICIPSFTGKYPSTGDAEIMKRVGKVFEQAYTRFLDLQKAEAQAREGQIELGLERVRARAMAMQKSDELNEVVSVLFEKIKELQIPATAVGIAIYIDGSKDLNAFVCGENQDGLVITNYRLPYIDNQITKDFNNVREKQLEFFVGNYSKEEKNSFYRYVLEHAAEFKHLPQDIKRMIFESPSYTITMVAVKNAVFNINDFEGKMLSESDVDIIRRFAIVFDQAYTRFLDLQRAEAQAREAKIEAALERVRSRTMAMQRSDELLDVASVLFQQVKALGVPQWNCGFNIWDIGDKEFTYYPGSPDGIISGSPCKIPLTEHPVFMRFDESRKRGDELLIYEKQGEEQTDHYRYMLSLPFVGDFLRSMLDAGFELPTFQIDHLANFAYGNLIFITYEHFPEMHDVFKRFARVFEQTYTRFLDLQKAEAQAKEAQIEAALERVRSRSLAMHKSNELQEVIETVFDQILKLGILADVANFIIFTQGNKDINCWIASPNLKINRSWYMPYKNIYPLNAVFIEKEKGYDSFSTSCSFEQKDAFFNWAFEHSDFKNFPDDRKQFVLESKCWTTSYAWVKHTGIQISNYAQESFAENENEILKRFARVFEQSYIRFLDLQKAEAQTREAQIETALEKVRSRSLAMHNTNELQEVVSVVLERMTDLNIEIDTININIYKEGSKELNLWTAAPGQKYAVPFHLPFFDHPFHTDIFIPKENGLGLFTKTYSYEEKNSYFNYTFEHSDFKNVPEVKKKLIMDGRACTRSIATTKNAGIIIIRYSDTPFSENENQILERFARVFEQAYTRFLDLQTAETQARESQIETGLEKVRSRTLAMQKSDELAETAAEVFKQLINLGIAPNRLYIGIVKDESGDMEMWATDEDGTKVGQKFIFNKNENASVKKLYDGWAAKEKSIVVDMEGKELEDYFHYLNDVMHIPFKAGLRQKRRVQSVAYFSKGFIGMASPDGQGNETIQLLERFAAVFNLTFTRFNDLKIAEAHAEQAEQDLIAIKEAKQKAEEALIVLQATQKQLIQSEKMASLGELTAGIAHEIQNPLNFVNNFSEVSKELLDEMKDELNNGNLEDAKEIMYDVIRNLEKINHHGKRADAIVKGMLQHSRSSGAIREPTDINALCDEYLRLSYHGLRAKDKSFNATMKTDFDDSIGNINIIPQDIGRVVLNLLTNAFYAVQQKQKELAQEKSSFQNLTSLYEPTVSISTKNVGDKVLISVSDNGNGIPLKVLDKIFQPFFTTKPTGQGTGLGLSLSYDIVKAHGGDVKVETKEGEGTDFIINLPAQNA
ncbi:MAG: ATP-binding protein [Ferruginibacter sp.]